MSEKPYTVATLAERWECTPEAIYTLIRGQKLKAFRVGGKLLRVQASEVARWENGGGSTALESTGSASSSGKQPLSGKTKRANTAEDLVSSLLK